MLELFAFPKPTKSLVGQEGVKHVKSLEALELGDRLDPLIVNEATIEVQCFQLLKFFDFNKSNGVEWIAEQVQGPQLSQFANVLEDLVADVQGAKVKVAEVGKLSDVMPVRWIKAVAFGNSVSRLIDDC